MDQGARDANESMFNEAVNKKLDRIIELLEKLIAASSQPKKLANQDYQGPLSVGFCDHGISYTRPCDQCGRLF